jgi:putative holliday junction resolvase
MKYLSVDYGQERIGLAESFGTLAEPLLIIGNNNKTLMYIKDLCIKKKVEALVVGMSERDMAKKTQQFAELLQTALGLPVYYQDETLSSVEIHRLMYERTAPGKRSYHGHIDHFAAALILQRYLDDQIGQL